MASVPQNHCFGIAGVADKMVLVECVMMISILIHDYSIPAFMYCTALLDVFFVTN